MSDTPRDRYLLTLAPELTTKANPTRRRFARTLAANVRDALSTLEEPYEVDPQWTRFFVRSAADGVVDTLRRIPGIASVARIAASCPPDMEPIVAAAVELFGDGVRGRTFAVRARRSGRHPFSSMDVQRAVGTALNPGATVDLTDPDVEVIIEVRDDLALLLEPPTRGAGGLPLGVEGRAVCLLSGGFDSAVAAWLLLKRGVEQEYVFCNLAGDAYERMVLQVAKVLSDRWSYGVRPRIHVVDFGAVLDEIRRDVDSRYWQVVLKRLMYRAAARVASEVRADAIVTGESVAQVSSQTLSNLRAIDAAVDLPVLRPLVGIDKNDIIEMSREIGSYAVSARVKEYCAITPKHPVTRTTVSALDRQEERFDRRVLARAMADRKTLRLRELSATDLVIPYLFTDEVPEGAAVLDVQADDEAAWRHPAAEVHDPRDLLARYRRLDRDRTYVLYCAMGIQSAQIAEAMQRDGYEAYTFRGGTKALRRAGEAVPAGSSSRAGGG